MDEWTWPRDPGRIAGGITLAFSTPTVEQQANAKHSVLPFRRLLVLKGAFEPYGSNTPRARTLGPAPLASILPILTLALSYASAGAAAEALPSRARGAQGEMGGARGAAQPRSQRRRRLAAERRAPCALPGSVCAAHRIGLRGLFGSCPMRSCRTCIQCVYNHEIHHILNYRLYNTHFRQVYYYWNVIIATGNRN